MPNDSSEVLINDHYDSVYLDNTCVLFEINYIVDITDVVRYNVGINTLCTDAKLNINHFVFFIVRCVFNGLIPIEWLKKGVELNNHDVRNINLTKNIFFTILLNELKDKSYEKYRNNSCMNDFRHNVLNDNPHNTAIVNRFADDVIGDVVYKLTSGLVDYINYYKKFTFDHFTPTKNNGVIYLKMNCHEHQNNIHNGDIMVYDYLFKINALTPNMYI